MPADQAPLQVPSPRPGMFVWYGRFKNRAGIITKVFKDDKGTAKVEVEPVPKGRKKPKTRNILPYRPMNQEDTAKYQRIYDEETRKLRERKKKALLLAFKVAARFEQDDLSSYLDEYATRHPQLARQLPKVVAKSGTGSGSHPEARQFGDEIWLYPKFWRLDSQTRDWVMTHELGHYVRGRRPLQWLIDTAARFGVDVWDSDSLPFGQFNMEEAFAESFAAYSLERSDLKSRYPAWVKIVEAA